MSLAQMFGEGFQEPARDTPLLLSVSEAHRRLGIGRTTFFAELGSGRMRSLKVGSRRLIPASALQEWIDNRLAEQFPAPDGGNSDTSNVHHDVTTECSVRNGKNATVWDASAGSWRNQG